MKNITKEEFIGLLSGAGVTSEQMQALHRSFEKRYPEQHEAFLRYLGIEARELAEIRRHSAS